MVVGPNRLLSVGDVGAAGVDAGVATAALAPAGGAAAAGCMAASLAFTSANCCERSSIFFCKSSVEGEVCAQLDIAPQSVNAIMAQNTNSARRSFIDSK